jgi:uncharacterized protein (TIGR00645 family)
MSSESVPRAPTLSVVIGSIIFWSRWLLVPLYLGLYVALAAYAYKFAQEVWEMLLHLDRMTEGEMVLTVLSLIDITLVGGLICSTMIGGFSIDVREFDYSLLKSKPRWLHGITTFTQKSKMGSALLGIASIYLLKSFLEAADVAWDTVLKQCLMIVIFFGVAAGYGVIARSTPHDHPVDPKETH